MRWSLVVVLCACSTYSVRRSALVPHIAPPARSGQPLAAQAEAALSTPNAIAAGSPVEGTGANAGLYLPRAEVGGALRLRATPDVDVGFLWDQGLDDGATAITPDQPRPTGDTYGGGLSLFYSGRAGEGWRVGLGVNLLVYSIPFIEYRTCIENCGGVMYTDVEEGRKSILVGSLAVVPSYRQGRWTVFGGLTARNHPTNTKGEIDNGGFFDDEDEVREGPLNLVVSAGAEFEIAGGVRALAQIYQPLMQDPVAYLPTLGLALTVPLGRPTNAQ